MNDDFEMKTSRITSQLDSRRDINKKFGSCDLDEWIVANIKIRDGENILDVGCGTGNHLVRFSELYKYSYFVGIDASETSIQKARVLAKNREAEVNFFVQSMENIKENFESHSYDNIMSIYALYYAHNTNDLLDALKNILKKNGRMMILSPCEGNNEGWYGFLRRFMEIPEEIEATNYFMDDHVIPYAKKNFSEIEMLPFVNEIVIPSFRDLKRYWEANIYHKEKYDAAFSSRAKEFFERNEKFTFAKRALLVKMHKKVNS